MFLKLFSERKRAEQAGAHVGPELHVDALAAELSAHGNSTLLDEVTVEGCCSIYSPDS